MTVQLIIYSLHSNLVFKLLLYNRDTTTFHAYVIMSMATFCLPWAVLLIFIFFVYS